MRASTLKCILWRVNIYKVGTIIGNETKKLWLFNTFINNQILKYMKKKWVSPLLSPSLSRSLSSPKLQPFCSLTIIMKVSSKPPADLHCEHKGHCSLDIILYTYYRYSYCKLLKTRTKPKHLQLLSVPDAVLSCFLQVSVFYLYRFFFPFGEHQLPLL